MPEPASIEPMRTAPEAQASNRDLRWPRLAANSIWIAICFGAGSFVNDLIGSVWNHNLKADIFSARVFWWLGQAIAFGVFCGLFIGFSTWLAQELFGRSKTDSSQ